MSSDAYVDDRLPRNIAVLQEISRTDVDDTMTDGSDDEGSLNESRDDEASDSESSTGDDNELPSTRNRFQEDFEDITEIGRGGFGTVYKAKNKVDGACYAVKRIRITTNKEKELREVKLHTALTHANVVRYFNAWIGEEKRSDSEKSSESSLSVNSEALEDTRHGGGDIYGIRNFTDASHQSQTIFEYLYIQTEFCEMGNLRGLIDEDLYKDKHQVWKFFREITEGLFYIHQQGVFHRDLKPENIFITSSSNIKIGDFGLATSELRLAQQSTLSKCGTISYMAPEVVTPDTMPDKRKLSKTDIYSLGLTFFEMNYPACKTQTERLQVFTGLRRKEITLPDDFLDGNCGTPQEKIVRWLINEDPDLRPTADEILNSAFLPALPEEEEKDERAISKIVSSPECSLYRRLVAKLFEQPTYSRVHDISDAREVSFVRYLSQTDVSSLRSYTIDRVYCKVRYHGITQMEHLECAFDIIEKTSPVSLTGAEQASKDFNTAQSPDSPESASSLLQYTGDELPFPNPSQADDSEIIHVVVKILEKFPVLAANGFTCYLNHTLLVQAVLLYVGVPVEKLNDAVSAVTAADLTEDNNMDADYYRKILSKLSGEPTIDAQVNELLKFEGSIDELSNKLKGILDFQTQASYEAQSGLHDLRIIIHRLRALSPNLMCRISLGLLTSARYSSGIIFQVTPAKVHMNQEVSTTVFAFGYRYDKLLNQLRRLKYEKDVLRGAGVSINIDLIVKSLAQGKRAEASLIRGEKTSILNIKSEETLNSGEASTSTVDNISEDFNKLTNKPTKKNFCFPLPSNSWDISMHQDRIFVAAYASGMYEYDLNGKQQSCWQAPSLQGSLAVGPENPPDSVYTVHAMLDGRVLVGLLKSRSVVVLQRKPPSAAGEYTNRNEGVTKWSIENSIKLDARPWRLSSDGSNRIAVIHANDNPKVGPGTKMTMISLSDFSCSDVYPFSFPITAVDVSESQVFVASVRDSTEGKNQKRCMVMAHKKDFALVWRKVIHDNIFDVACDSSRCTLYLALGVSRSVITLNSVNGNIQAKVLPYCEECPFRLSLANGSLLSLAVLRYDKKTVEVHTVN